MRGDGARSRLPLARGDYAGIELRVRGDGRTYTFRLETVDRIAYWADFGTPERYYQGNVDALERRMTELSSEHHLGGAWE